MEKNNISNEIPSRITVYNHEGKPYLSIMPASSLERLSRYIYNNVPTLLALAVGVMVYSNSKNGISLSFYIICFGPSVVLFTIATGLSYYLFGKTNSKKIGFLCDSENLIITIGRKETTYPIDKIRLELHYSNKYGAGFHGFYKILVFLRREEKRRKRLFRVIRLNDKEIEFIKHFTEKNNIHYKKMLYRLGNIQRSG